MLKVITSLSWGPVPDLYVLRPTDRVHEPEERKLPPVASLLVLAVEVSVKELPLLVNARVTPVVASAALKTSPLANRKLLSFRSLEVASTRRAMAGLEVAVIDPFETVIVLLILSKSQGLNVITSFTCGPVSGV
jgi:hypothetical protein